MAKTVRTSNLADRRLPNFLASGSEVLVILRRVLPEGARLLVEIDNPDGESKTVVEGLDDLAANVSLLRSSLKITTDEFTVRVGRYRDSIEYSLPCPPSANAIIAEFQSLTPWYRQFHRFIVERELIVFITFFLIGFGTVTIFRSNDGVTNRIFIGFLLAMIAVIFLFVLDRQVTGRAKIYYKLKDTWIRRNSDKIIWSCCTFAFGIVLANWKWFF